jgi:hypothetical protein
VVVVATRQNTTSRVVVSVATAQNTTRAAVVRAQNATCGRRVRRIVVVGSDGGAESRLSSSVRGFVGRGAVVPSETDVAEDRGDYATFFVGCCVVVSCVVEGVVVAVAAGEGVDGRHGCSSYVVVFV